MIKERKRERVRVTLCVYCVMCVYVCTCVSGVVRSRCGERLKERQRETHIRKGRRDT